MEKKFGKKVVELRFYGSIPKRKLLDTLCYKNWHQKDKSIRYNVRFIILGGFYYEYLGMSRIGYPIIEIPIIDLIFLRDNKEIYGIECIYEIPINDLEFYKKGQIFSEVDPYGEENWND